MRRTVILSTALIAGLAVVALAAFVGARLFERNQPGVSSSLEPTPLADEQHPAGLPQRAPDDSGVILKIDDNSLFIGSGQTMLAANDENGKPGIEIENATSPLEVVLTQNTQVFRDTTYDDPTVEDGAPQTIEAFNMGDLSENNIVFVWGTKRGDRLVAETILYNELIPVAR